MRRHYFISTDLEALEHFQQELKQAGFVTPQIHALTDEEDTAHRHGVHQVTPFMKSDIVHSTLIGAVCGIFLAAMVYLVTLLAGWHDTVVGGIPFIFLAIILLGFCTWEGGLRGIQVTNSRTRAFKQHVREGKHVFFVDQPRGRGTLLTEIAERYPNIEMAGQGRGAPAWLVFSQHNIKRFFTRTFP